MTTKAPRKATQKAPRKATRKATQKATRKVLVFVHGIDGDGTTAQGAADAMFEDRFRVVTYDLLGRGGSLGKNIQDHSLGAYVAQLRNIVVGISSPVYLVGYSMGGAIAAAFADKYPDLVVRLALICPAGRISSTGSRTASSLSFSLWRAVVPWVMFKKMRSSFEGVESFKNAVERKRALYSDHRFLRVLYDTFLQFPLHNLPLRGVSVRTLIVSADSDMVVPKGAVQRLSDSFTDKTIKTFKGTHALPFRKPKTIGRAVTNFFVE